MEPVKVLYINGGLMDYGGISTVMMNYFKYIDPRFVKIDFVVHGRLKGDRDDEILERGSSIFYVPAKSVNYLENYKRLNRIMTDGGYQIVHAHADAGNAYILRIAKMCNIAVRISHSHSTNFLTDNKFRVWLNQLQKKYIKEYATEYWACSQAAGKWLYGEIPFEVITNAIEVKRYLFSEDKRDNIRKNLKLENDYVIGIVGRLELIKNHRFILKVLKAIKKSVSKYKLLIVGDGELRQSLLQMVNEIGLEDNVLFTGNVNQIEYYYSAMDLLVMPSLFEGLPMVALEAQCSGLPCLLSSGITTEVKILETVEFLDLQEKIWIDRILKKMEFGKRITDVVSLFRKQGFDLELAAKRLQEKYINLREMRKI